MHIELIDIWSLSDDSDTAGALPLVPAAATAAEIDEAKSAFPASPAVWFLAWSLRRQTWRDLIANGHLDVTFHHDAESGDGSATFRFTGQGVGSVTMEAPGFDRSDAMHMDYSDEVGLFGWQEYRVTNLDYEARYDSELFEHSFTSTDRVAVVSNSNAVGVPWADVPESVQVAAAVALIMDLHRQEAEYAEIVTDHLDVLLTIAIHPDSSSAVVEEVKLLVPTVAETMGELGRAP